MPRWWQTLIDHDSPVLSICSPRVGQEDTEVEQRLRDREAEECVEEEAGKGEQVHGAHALSLVGGGAGGEEGAGREMGGLRGASSFMVLMRSA